MSRTSKSPRKVAIYAMHFGQRTLPAYSHRFSPKTFTLAQLFACLVMKTFFKTDYRGITQNLNDHAELRHILGLQKVPHFTTLQKASKRLLQFSRVEKLLAQTVRTLRPRRKSIKRAAADATGFEAGQVSPYFVRRRQRGEKDKQNPLFATTTYRRFPKLNIICDCQTHMILATHPSRGPSPDGPDLPTLLERLPPLPVVQLLADAGYDGEHHHRMLREDHGIGSLIPPKIGRPTKKRATGRYRRLMQRIFKNASRTKYGQRWQVETVFSMIKRNLGCAVRGRSYWSQCREMMLLALTHNVMIVLW